MPSLAIPPTPQRAKAFREPPTLSHTTTCASEANRPHGRDAAHNRVSRGIDMGGLSIFCSRPHQTDSKTARACSPLHGLAPRAHTCTC